MFSFLSCYECHNFTFKTFYRTSHHETASYIIFAELLQYPYVMPPLVAIPSCTNFKSPGMSGPRNLSIQLKNPDPTGIRTWISPGANTRMAT